MKENWSNDPRVGCKSLLYLGKLIEKDLTFLKNLESLKVHLNRMKF